MLLWKDKHFMNWRKQQQQTARKELPSPARKNHKQEHDTENPQLEEPRRVHLGGGHWYDPLFSGAIPRGQYLSPGHGSAVAVCL